MTGVLHLWVDAWRIRRYPLGHRGGRHRAQGGPWRPSAKICPALRGVPGWVGVSDHVCEQSVEVGEAVRYEEKV